MCVVLPLVLAASRAWPPAEGDRARAAPPPVRPEGEPTSAGPQHLAVLRAARWRRDRRGTHYRPDLVVLGRGQFGLVVAAFSVGLALLAAWRSSRADASTSRPTLVVALLSAFLAVQLVHTHRRRHRCGRARLAPCRRVVRAERRPQVLLNGHRRTRATPSTSSLGARTGERTPEEMTPRSPTTPASAWPVLAPADGQIVEVTDHLRRQSARHQQRPSQQPGDRHRWRPLRVDGPPPTGQRHRPGGRRRTSGSAARRSREQRPHERAAPPPAGPGLASRQGRRAHLPHGVPRRPHHQGRPWPWGDSRELRTGDLVRDLAR